MSLKIESQSVCKGRDSEMREIKFRAWDLADKCWDYPKTEYAISKGASDYFSRIGPMVRFNRGDIVLMQFNGLKDKSGKEIYEGDIVRFDDGTVEIGRVFWHGQGWDISPQMRRNPAGRIGGQWSKFIEVIGNIYENPELLGA